MGGMDSFGKYRVAAAMAALFLAAGCQGVEKTDATALSDPKPAAHSACEAAPTGKRGAASFTCFADAGKACSDGSDCQGDCLVPRDRTSRTLPIGAEVMGQCQATSSPFGCRATVEKGRVATPWVCRD
jgi:hypothetical protein